jgi:tetratricopeptide (TPR) repeat protein
MRGVFYSLLLASWGGAAGSLSGCASGGGQGPYSGAAREQPAAEPQLWAESLDEALFGSSEAELAKASARRQSARQGERAPRAVETPASPGEEAARSTPSQPLERAGRLLQEGRLEEAVGVLEEALAADQGNSRFLLERALADALLGLEENEKAARVYASILAPLHSNLAVACYRLGDAARARTEAEEALRFSPDCAEAMKTLGLVELGEGRRESSAAWLRKAIALKPDIPEAQAALAEIEEAAGDSAAALRRYRDLFKTLEKARASDFHRRWQNLFYPREKDSAAALKARIQRLEALTGERQ